MAMDFSRYGMALASKYLFFWAMKLGYNDVALFTTLPASHRQS
jgi:hypothetical protein